MGKWGGSLERLGTIGLDADLPLVKERGNEGRYARRNIS